MFRYIKKSICYGNLVMLGALWVMLTSSAACYASQRPKLRSEHGNYELEVIVDGASVSPYRYRGQDYVAGEIGERYVLRVHNHSGVRTEVVATVDGLDVIDGKRGDYGKRGYIVAPWGYVDIDGWRQSASHVAAFRFSSVGASYAGRKGKDRNVGVIGVAVFPERHYHRPHIRRPIRRHSRYRRQRHSGNSADVLGDMDMAESAPSYSGSASASRQKKSSRGAGRYRPGLGTEYGESRYSSTYEVDFRRASRHPAKVLGLRYNTARGLAAMGVPLGYDSECGPHGRDSWCRNTARPFSGSPGRAYAQPPGY